MQEAWKNRDRYIEARVEHVTKKIDALIENPDKQDCIIRIGGDANVLEEIRTELISKGYSIPQGDWVMFPLPRFSKDTDEASKKREAYKKSCIETLEKMIEDCISCKVECIKLRVQHIVSYDIVNHFKQKGYDVMSKEHQAVFRDIEINFPSF